MISAFKTYNYEKILIKIAYVYIKCSYFCSCFIVLMFVKFKIFLAHFIAVRRNTYIKIMWNIDTFDVHVCNSDQNFFIIICIKYTDHVLSHIKSSKKSDQIWSTVQIGSRKSAYTLFNCPSFKIFFLFFFFITSLIFNQST